jgi:hypothetical protein
VAPLGRAASLPMIEAADFINGGAPTIARVFDRRGVEIGAFERDEGETLDDFRLRARQSAQEAPGAARVVLGGLRSSGRSAEPGGLPRAAVALSEVPFLHPSQREALALIENNRRVALAAGRRWGKSSLLIALSLDYAIAGRSVGLFAPTFKFLKPLLDDIALALARLPGISINRSMAEIRLRGGGALDFWSLDFTGRAARGRKYHLRLVDESAHDGGYLKGTLEAAITPATLDYKGKIVLASTPNGLEGAFWEAANLPERRYVTHHAPTSANPCWLPEDIAEMRATMPPELASQEFDALFVDVGGATIFPLANLLIDGEPHADDGFVCEHVGLAIDSNSGKGGPDRDGVAGVIFAAVFPKRADNSLEGARVVIVDWDIQSLAQGGVVSWIQDMRGCALEWFKRLRPLMGLPAAYVEPAGNGYSIIEACRELGLNPHEIDTKHVGLGKDGRALAVEPHASMGRVKIGRAAFDKRTNYRGIVANHLVRQVTGFRAFNKDSYKREDDLFDAAMYAALVTFGDGTEARWSRLK